MKKRGERKIDEFRKKSVIPESEISECPEHKVKPKRGKVFVNEKIMEEYCVKIDENERDYILFRIDVYFIEYNLAVEVDEKGHVNRDLIFEKKKDKL